MQVVISSVNFQVTPAKFLRTAFGIRGLSSAYISRVFLRTEMALKSRNVLTGSRSLARSRSTDNLPTSQSQVNIQMMSHTLTIREVRYLSSSFFFNTVSITEFSKKLLEQVDSRTCKTFFLLHLIALILTSYCINSVVINSVVRKLVFRTGMITIIFLSFVKSKFLKISSTNECTYMWAHFLNTLL